jgi:epoxyqueuosine reductase QueG
MKLTEEISKLLKNEGCKIFGFADFRGLPAEPRRGADFGIIMGEPYTATGMMENLEGKPERFAADSEATFEPLKRYKAKVMQLLRANGYKPDIKYRSTISRDCPLAITHKMIGTLSGIGWIGRCAILTTEKFGPALRLVALGTNAPLECGTPITKSLCPLDCTACADICPTNAIKEGLWKQGIHRDEFFDVKACCKGRSARKPMCGLCISACPFTKKGLGYQSSNH